MNGFRKIRWGLLVAASLAADVSAQPVADTSWVLLDHSGADTLGVVHATNAREASARALTVLADSGYVYARVDTIEDDRSIRLRPGRLARVRGIDVVGATALNDVTLWWGTQAGKAFRPRVLDADLAATAQRYLIEGYPEVELVPRLALDSAGVRLRVDVTEGPRAILSGVELVGSRRPSRALATRVSGLRAGTPFESFDPAALRADLEATGLFLDVGAPTLAVDGRRQLVVQVPVRDGPPGTFDLVLGYLPPVDASPGGVVGSGRLELRNPFGGGRRVDIRLDRTPGLVSAFDLAVADPFVAGLPVGLAGAFSGYGRDSTFSRQRVRLETKIRVAPGLSLSLSSARETVSPGSFGVTLVNQQQRVVRSFAWFAGVGLEFRAVDAPLNPRKGIVLAIDAEQGRRRRTPDTGEQPPSSQLQRRMDLSGRVYIPTTSRQAAVLGIDGSAVLTSSSGDGDPLIYDEGELLRIGGATSLRGYDEEAFLGNIVGRLLAEYRVLIGPQTFAFGFGDLGYVEMPDLPGRTARREGHVGYGAGIQIRTGIGLASVTYALNPDLPGSRGKVHVGLNIGL